VRLPVAKHPPRCLAGHCRSTNLLSVVEDVHNILRMFAFVFTYLLRIHTQSTISCQKIKKEIIKKQNSCRCIKLHRIASFQLYILHSVCIFRMGVFSTHLLIPSVSWRNPGLYWWWCLGALSGLCLQGWNKPGPHLEQGPVANETRCLTRRSYLMFALDTACHVFHDCIKRAE